MNLIPYSFYDPGTSYFWAHFGLVILGFILAVITCISQWIVPAPYGKHQRKAPGWGPEVPQRLSHMFSDSVTGIIMFSLVFFLFSEEESDKGVVNYVLYGIFIIHTLHRGLITPLTMRYKSPTVPLGITLGTIFPNALYQWLISNHIGVAGYDKDYCYDPRFIVGILMYFTGFIINRWADYKLRSLRSVKGCTGYYIPYGGLFDLIVMPNYFGELVQWIGWTIATWSLSGVVWTLFCAATFVARSRHNLVWYKEQFENYPSNRKALIPFLF